MKSLNIKIPMRTAQLLDDNAELNPNYISSFIKTHLQHANTAKDHTIPSFSYNYTFKVPSDLHKEVKLKAIELDVPMNELVGKLLDYYYKG